MALIAIAPAGAGVVFVEEFREAVDAATALTAFVNDYSPPKIEANYIAHDTGWGSVQQPTVAGRWSYDHGILTIVESLVEIKAIRYDEINERTRQLIQQGFEFPALSGNIFSLHQATQSNLHKLQLLKDDPVTVYPQIWTRKDGSGIHSIAGAVGANAFYTKAMSTIDGHRNSGRVLKNLIRAAVDAAAVAAIIDTR